ncbi:MAG: N-6 DNA methylase, partial [Euryarchaeota archaeon]|nr:N-6 DNA methylase [Euryarchaeota archaeon]
EEEIGRIASTYHAWRGEVGEYEDVPGFCRAVGLNEIGKHGYILTPGRYVGAEEVKDDGEPFDEMVLRLTAELSGQFEKSKGLEEEIRKNLAGLGFNV